MNWGIKFSMLFIHMYLYLFLHNLSVAAMRTTLASRPSDNITCSHSDLLLEKRSALETRVACLPYVGLGLWTVKTQRTLATGTKVLVTSIFALFAKPDRGSLIKIQILTAFSSPDLLHILLCFVFCSL